MSPRQTQQNSSQITKSITVQRGIKKEIDFKCYSKTAIYDLHEIATAVKRFRKNNPPTKCKIIIMNLSERWLKEVSSLNHLTSNPVLKSKNT